MAATTAWLYPKSDSANAGTPFSPNDNGGGTWGVATPTYAAVDDPHGAPDFSDYGAEAPIGAATVWSAEWDLTVPPSGVTIVSLILRAWIWATSENSTPHDLTACKMFVRPGGAGTRDKKTLGTGTISGTTGAQGPNPAVFETAAWTVNPSTGLAWTIPDLQALVIGVEWSDIDPGSNTPRTWLGGVEVQVAATTIAQTTERFRVMGSAALRGIRIPYEITTIVTDGEFADITPGQPFVIDHQLGPHPLAAPPIALTPAVGWGKRNWERRDHICLSTVVRPELLEVGVEGWDARAFRTRLWGVFKHDLGYSDEGQGVAWLDSGGGRTVARAAQAGYVRKHPLDTLYAQVPADFAKWDPEGLRLEGGGDVNRLLNSSFSQGSGSTFTSWTHSGTGSVAEDLVNFLFDAAGLRRAAKLTQGSTTTGYFLQATAATADAYARARVIGRVLTAASAGDGKIYIAIQRSADSKYLDNSTTPPTWVVANTSNPVYAGAVGAFDWSSQLIPNSGTSTFTVTVGFLGAGTGGVVVLQEVEFSTGTQAQMAAIRSPLVTTTTAVTRVTDSFLAQNNQATRWWDPTTRGGTILVRFKTLFDHDDLVDAEVRGILYQVTTGTRSEALYYIRVNSSEAAFVFQRFDGSTTYLAQVATDHATYLSECKLAIRWIGPDLELGLTAYTLKVYAVHSAGFASVASVPQTIAVNVNGLFGSLGGQAQDIIISEIESFDGCLTDEEIYARLG